MGEHKFKKSRQSKPPSTKSRSQATAVIVLAVIAVVICMDVMQRKENSGLNDFVAQRTKGSDEAPVKVVEFLDFQCSHCKDGAEILKEIMMMHPDKIQLTLKYFPLSQLNSSISAYYAECAGAQGKFWPMHDQLFQTQDEWRTLLKVRPVLERLAANIGLNPAELESCIESKKTKKIVSQDKTLGESYSVRSTPTYFINGEMTVGIHSMKKILAEYLEK